MTRWRPSAADLAWERREREAVLERDGYRCQCRGCAKCVKRPTVVLDGCAGLPLEVDHDQALGSRVPGGRYNREHPLNQRSNKITRCRDCHREKTYGRAAA